MLWLFAIIGAIALVITFNLCRTTATDIAYIAASILVLGFVISLVVAPWQVKLFLLVLIFLTNMRQSPQPEKVEKENQEAAAKIFLSYRGEKYEVNTPPIELTEDEIVGKYRGQIVKTHQPKQCPASPNLEIKYRGAKINRISLTDDLANQAILDSFTPQENFINSGIIDAKQSPASQ
ncbi:MAG TPA: DUF4278 domain-containing protein [Oscillatoriaceae cyanobacterium M33_DOE_052]|nr:DUF4278 domain-containing protein [Oscillatoriaceae cyanobacterium M33_DOE_052]